MKITIVTVCVCDSPFANVDSKFYYESRKAANVDIPNLAQKYCDKFKRDDLEVKIVDNKDKNGTFQIWCKDGHFYASYDFYIKEVEVKTLNSIKNSASKN